MGGFCGGSVSGFVGALGSGAAVPGGGGAAALCGALGAALGAMVANLTVGKAKYADVSDELMGLGAEAERLASEFLLLMERDAEVFAPLAVAYGMAAGTEAERVEKGRVMQGCLAAAALVPLEIMEKCVEALGLLEVFAEKGSALAVSDAGCGAALCGAALRAAWLNVRVNTRLISDEAAAGGMDARGRGLLAAGVDLAERVFAAVERRLG